jgi:hypothetical protein
MCFFDYCFEKEKKNKNEFDELNNIMQQINVIRDNTEKKINEIVTKNNIMQKMYVIRSNKNKNK